MSGSSRSGVLRVTGGAATVVAAFALIGAGVQLARNAEGYEVKTGALEEATAAPATVIDDEALSTAPAPPVVPEEDATGGASTPTGGSAPNGGSPPPGGGSEGGDGGGGDDPTDPDVPPELDPIIGLVDDITSAADQTLGDTGAADETLVDTTTETFDDATSSLSL